MLILTRKCGQSIAVGDDIEIEVMSISGGQVSIGISAPKHIHILRDDAKERTAKHREQDKDVTYSKSGDL